MKILKKLLLNFILILLLTSCIKDYGDKNNIKVIGVDGNPLVGVKVDIFKENPINEDGTLNNKIAPVFYNLEINKEGIVTISNINDTLFVKIGNPAYDIKKIYPNGYNNITNTYNLYPNGYKTNQIRVVGNAGSVTKYLSNNISTRLKPTDNLYVLGNYSSNGFPYYLVNINKLISNDLILALNKLLPPGKGTTSTYIPNQHPEWFKYDSLSNINFEKEATCTVTFITEGAGVNNTLGYFYYPTNNPPKTASDIDKLIVIYPNSSGAGSGGNLSAGNTTQLKYFNGSKWVDIFPKGITVSWFIATDGWMIGSQYGSYLKNNTVMQYSLKKLNNANKSQGLLFFDEVENNLLLTFEDVSCSDVSGGGKIASDQDFNDLIYVVDVYPANAIRMNSYHKYREIGLKY